MKRRFSLFTLTAVSVVSVLVLMFQPWASATVPGVNTLVSEGYGSVAANYGGYFQNLSADGRFVTFYSQSSDILVNDMNGWTDVFVRDLANNTTTIASVSSSGVQGNGPSVNSAISRTGRYVLFWSTASNLIDGSTIPTTYEQLYLRDMVSNTTTLLSQNASGVAANNNVAGLDVSSDGRFVLFLTAATNLGPVVTNTGKNLYMLDRATGTFTILNRASDGSLLDTTSYTPYAHMSCDGSLVVFQSGANLTGNSNGISTYLLDRRAGDRLTNITSSANSSALGATISCNGDYIGFASTATNLDTTITDTSMMKYHAYVYNRVDGTFSIVDQSSSGITGNSGVFPWVGARGEDQFMQLSDNGIAVFHSTASNLTSEATAGTRYVYVRDINSSAIELLCKDSNGAVADGECRTPSVSSDGRISAYMSAATNLVTNDANGYQDIYTSKTGY